MNGASWLYAPAFTSDLLGRATALGADVAVFDLEDAVPYEQKQTARDAVLRQLSENSENSSGPPTAVRINALDSKWGMDDLSFLRDHAIRTNCILIPKARLIADSEIVFNTLCATNPDLQVSCIVESIASWGELQRVAALPSFVHSITFGSLDFAADICTSPFEFDFTRIKQDIVLHAKRLGVRAVDTPCFNINVDAEIRADVRAARRIGFDGKVGIHPRQIPIINSEFQADVELAREMTAVINAAGGNAQSALKRFGDMAYGPPIVRYLANVIARETERGGFGLGNNDEADGGWS